MNTSKILDTIEGMIDYISHRNYDGISIEERDAIWWSSVKVESLLHRFLGKGYDCPTETEVAAHAQFVANPKVIYDIGANIGDWSVAALKRFPGAIVYAFEPSHDHTDALQSIKAEYGDRFHVVTKGVSDRIGTAPLFKTPDNHKLASLHQRDLSFYNLDMNETETIELITIDEFSREMGIDRVDIIKIDVEGHEMPALLGAAAMIDTATTIQFEFGGTMLDSRYFMKDFATFFRERNFRLNRFAMFGLWQMHEYWESHEAFDLGNYLAYRLR